MRRSKKAIPLYRKAPFVFLLTFICFLIIPILLSSIAELGSFADKPEEDLLLESTELEDLEKAEDTALEEPAEDKKLKKKKEEENQKHFWEEEERLSSFDAVEGFRQDTSDTRR